MATTKSTLKRIFCVISCCLVVVFSFAFPSSAVNTDYTFNFPIPNPATNFDGYVIVPIRLSNGDITADMFFWDISSSHTIDGTDVSSIGDLQVNVTVENSNIYFDFISTDTNSSFIVTLYQSRANGTLPLQNNSTYFVSYNSPAQPYLGGVTYYKITDFSGVLRLNNNTRNTLTYDTVFSDNNAVFNELLSVNEHFVSMLQKQDYTNEQLESLVEQFQYLLDTCYNIDYALSEFVFIYWNQFQNQDFPGAMNDISSKLQKIINLLNKSGDVEQTTVDSSKVDEYLDIEQSLIDNENAESALNEIDISIDGASYKFIWDFITACFNSHPEVFGLVIAILSLGIIALILNR